MKKSKYSDSQILTILNQSEAGIPVPKLCREHGMSSATFYKWRAKYGGMDASLMARTKVRSPQTNGICERFHKTILQEFYQIMLRKKVYKSVEELQNDLDEWLNKYNTERTHQGKMCCGRTPMETLIDGKQIWQTKFNL